MCQIWRPIAEIAARRVVGKTLRTIGFINGVSMELVWVLLYGIALRNLGVQDGLTLVKCC